MYNRIQQLKDLDKETCFLWGARQTGKSTLVKQLFPKSKIYDLLRSSEVMRLSLNPSLLAEEALLHISDAEPIIIDEVQKVPALLDEVHWLITNHPVRFILCGSSARKLKRSGANLLGGRALRYELFPLVYPEIPDFDLLRALNNGLLPRHYNAKNALPMLRAYVVDYLKEEIAVEASLHNIPVFNTFLQAAAFSNGEIVNYVNIARDCSISAPTVKEYFNILQDTLLGRFVFSYRKRPKRRVIHAPKFYFFDVGIVNVLLNRGKISSGSEIFGKAFEHFIFQEITAHSHYSGKHYPVSYWRTASGLEVDFILGEHKIALEVKGSRQVHSSHYKNLYAFQDEYPSVKSIIVSLDANPRKSGKIFIMPWKYFLDKLWNDELI